MISYSKFGALRLSQFLPASKIEEVEELEFLDAVWVGEAFGFSQWLRPESAPAVLRSLSIDFSDFPPKASTAATTAIDLPVRRGMTIEELRLLLGTPVEEITRVKDRITYEFDVAGPPRYLVSATILKRGGLTYLVVTRPLSKSLWKRMTGWMGKPS